MDAEDLVRASPHDPFGAFAELSRIMLTTQSLDTTLGRIAELARRTVGEATDVSVTLLERDRPVTAVFTGDLAAFLDERQYEIGFGPCIEAALTGATIIIADTSASDVHPDFARTALRHGVTHTLSVGLPVEHRTIGAINVYGTGPGSFDAATVETVTSFAGSAAVAAANADIHASTANLARNLERALESRAVIDQAKGILMARHGMSPSAAFDLLSEQSQRTNRKLRALAEDLVAETQRGPAADRTGGAPQNGAGIRRR
jgi:GAF domain-containing protein